MIRILEKIQLPDKKPNLMNSAKMSFHYFFLFVVFSIAYASLAPNIFQQDWDSLMYAYWAEVNGIKSIWGNHPLGHIILNFIFIIISYVGYYGKALPIFIVCNSIIGGAAVTLLFFLMKIMKFNRLFSFGYAILFGASYGLWHYSGSADVYSFSILVLILAWIFLIHEVFFRERRCLYISGLFAGLSILSHQLNGVFLLVALIVILFQKNNRWTRIVTFYTTVFVIVLAGGFIFGYIATSSFSVFEIYNWFRGYLGEPIYRNSLTLENFQISLKKALEIVLVPTFGRARFIRTTIISFFLGAVLLGMTQIKFLGRRKKIILLSAFSQWLASLLLIVWFEPWYPKFWLLILVPSIIIFASCIDALEMRFIPWCNTLWYCRKYYSLLILVIGLVVAIFNIRFAILDEHDLDQISQESMNAWLENSNQGDMLITAGDLIPQLWFWSNRPNTIHLYHYLVVDKNSNDHFKYLRGQINQFLCDGNAVFLAPDIVDNFGKPFLLWLDLPRDSLRTFFDSYQKERSFTYKNLINGDETQVYELVNPNACGE